MQDTNNLVDEFTGREHQNIVIIWMIRMFFLALLNLILYQSLDFFFFF